MSEIKATENFYYYGSQHLITSYLLTFSVSVNLSYMLYSYCSDLCIFTCLFINQKQKGSHAIIMHLLALCN